MIAIAASQVALVVKHHSLHSGCPKSDGCVQLKYDMHTPVDIEKAGQKDFDTVCQLLVANNLPIADLNPFLENFLIAREDDQIAGVMGMDRYGAAGLLRSAVVKASRRNNGVAAALVNQLLDLARQEGVTALYLITNTAEEYFAGKGFTKISREAVPETVLQSKEFNGLCPASSVIMYRHL